MVDIIQGKVSYGYDVPFSYITSLGFCRVLGRFYFSRAIYVDMSNHRIWWRFGGFPHDIFSVTYTFVSMILFPH